MSINNVMLNIHLDSQFRLFPVKDENYDGNEFQQKLNNSLKKKYGGNMFSFFENKTLE